MSSDLPNLQGDLFPDEHNDLDIGERTLEDMFEKEIDGGEENTESQDEKGDTISADKAKKNLEHAPEKRDDSSNGERTKAPRHVHDDAGLGKGIEIVDRTNSSDDEEIANEPIPVRLYVNRFGSGMSLCDKASDEKDSIFLSAEDRQEKEKQPKQSVILVTKPSGERKSKEIGEKLENHAADENENAESKAEKNSTEEGQAVESLHEENDTSTDLIDKQHYNDNIPGENNDIDEGQPIGSILPENGMNISDPIESDVEDNELKGLVKTLISDLEKQVAKSDDEDEKHEEEKEEAEEKSTEDDEQSVEEEEKKEEEKSEEHRCELCDVTYPEWEQLVQHYDDKAHGEKYLTTQITMGFTKFEFMYEDVPFRMKDPKNIANLEKTLNTLDVHLLRTGLVKENHCSLCEKEIDGEGELEQWKEHIADELHRENYDWEMATLKTTEAYRKKFGCLPVPDVFIIAELSEDEREPEPAAKSTEEDHAKSAEEENQAEDRPEASTMDDIPDTPSPGTPPHTSSKSKATLPFHMWDQDQDDLLIEKWTAQGKTGCPDSQCAYYRVPYHGLDKAETLRDHWRSWHMRMDCKVLWQCPLCNATYVWKEYFIIHMSSKHGYGKNVGEFTMMLLRQRWRMEDEANRVTVYEDDIGELERGVPEDVRITITNAVAEIDEQKAHLLPEDLESMDMDLPSTTWTLHEDEALIMTWDRAGRKGCINEDCDSYGVSDKLFEPDALRDHWRTSHMKKSGRLQWLCPACPNKKYSQGKTLVRHLTNYHKFTDPLVGRWCKHLLREKWKLVDRRRRVLVYDDVQDQELSKTPVTGTAKQLAQYIFGFSINIKKLSKKKVAQSLEQTKQRLALKKEQKEQKQKEKKEKKEMKAKEKEKEDKAKSQQKAESKPKETDKPKPKDTELDETKTNDDDGTKVSKDAENKSSDQEEKMDTTESDDKSKEKEPEAMETEAPAEDEEMPFFKIECVISNADQVHASAQENVIETDDTADEANEDAPDQSESKSTPSKPPQTPPKSAPQTPPKSAPKTPTKSTTKETVKSTPPKSAPAPKASPPKPTPPRKGPSIAPIKKEKKIPTKMPLMPYTTWTEAEDLALVKEWSRQGKNQCIEPNCDHKDMTGLDNIDYFRDHWKNKHMWPKCALYFCCPFGCFNEDNDTVHSSLDYVAHMKKKHCGGNEDVAKYCLWLSREYWFKQDSKHRVNRYLEEETLKVSSYYRKLFTDLIFGVEVKLTKCSAKYTYKPRKDTSKRKQKPDSQDDSKKKRGRPKKSLSFIADSDDEGIKREAKKEKRDDSVESEPPKKKRGRPSSTSKKEEKTHGRIKTASLLDTSDSDSESDVEDKKKVVKEEKVEQTEKKKEEAKDDKPKTEKDMKHDDKTNIKEPKSPNESIKSEATSDVDVLAGLPHTTWTMKEDEELISKWKEQNLGCIHPKCHHYKTSGFGLDKSTQFRDHWRSEHVARPLRMSWRCLWCSKCIMWNEDFVRHVQTTHLENSKEAAYYYLHKIRQRWAAASDNSNERVLVYEDADYAKNLQSCVPAKHKEKIDELVFKPRRSVTPDKDPSRESSKERSVGQSVQSGQSGLPGYTWTLREDEALMAKWDRFGAKGCIDKSCSSFGSNHHMLDEPMPFRDHWRTKHMVGKNNIVWACPYCSKAPYDWADFLHRHLRKQHNKSRAESTYVMCLLRRKWQLEDVNGRIEPNSKGTMARLEKDIHGNVRRQIYDRIIGSRKATAMAQPQIDRVQRIAESPDGTPEPVEPGKLPDGLPEKTWTDAEDELLISEWEKRGKGGCIDVKCPCYGKHPRLTRPTSFRDHWRSKHMAPESRISWQCPLRCSSQFEWAEDVLRHITEVHRYQLRQSAQFCQHLIRYRWQLEDKDNRVVRYEQQGYVKNLLAVVPPFTKKKFEDLILPKEVLDAQEAEEKTQEENKDAKDVKEEDKQDTDEQGEKKFTIPKVSAVSKLKEQVNKPIHSPVEAAYPEVLKPLLAKPTPTKKPLLPIPNTPTDIKEQSSYGTPKAGTAGPKVGPNAHAGLHPKQSSFMPNPNRKSWRESSYKEMPGMPYTSWLRPEEDNLLRAYHRQAGRQMYTCVHPDCEWYAQAPKSLRLEPKFVEHWKVNHMKLGLELRWECSLCDAVWRWEDEFLKFHLLRGERGGHMLPMHKARKIVDTIKRNWRRRLEEYNPDDPKYAQGDDSDMEEEETAIPEVKKEEKNDEVDWSKFDPPEMPEMPYTTWKQEQEKKLIQVFENQADEKRFTCIHPECPWYARAPKILEKTEKFLEHWKVAHMAFGYRFVVQCPYCTSQFRWLHELIAHFQAPKENSGHDLDVDTAEGMAEGCHWNWENHLHRMQRPVQDKAITSTEEGKDAADGTPSEKNKPYAESQYWRFTKYPPLVGLPHTTWLEKEDEALMEEFNKRGSEEGAAGTCVHPQCDLYTEGPTVMKNEFVFREHWLVSHMEEKLLFQCSICAKTCRWGHELEEHFRSGLDKLGHSLDAFTALVMKEEIITKWVEKDPDNRKIVRAPLPVSSLSELKLPDLKQEEEKKEEEKKEEEKEDEVESPPPMDTAIDDDDDDDNDEPLSEPAKEERTETKEEPKTKEDDKKMDETSQASSGSQPASKDISEAMKKTLEALRQTTSQLLQMQKGPAEEKKEEAETAAAAATPDAGKSPATVASPIPGTSTDDPQIQKVMSLVKQTQLADKDKLNEKTVAVLIRAIKESISHKDLEEAEEAGMEPAEEDTSEENRFFGNRIPGIMESPTEDPADREYRYSQFGHEARFPELGLDPEHHVESVWDQPRKPGLLDHHPSLDRGLDEDLRHQPKKRGLLDEHPVYGLESGPPQIPGILDNHPVLGLGRDEQAVEPGMSKTGLLDDHPQFGLEGKRQGLLDNHPRLGVRDIEENVPPRKQGLLDAHPKLGLGAQNEPKRGLLDDHPMYGIEEDRGDWPRGEQPKRGLLGDPPADWESGNDPGAAPGGDYDHVPYTSDTGYRSSTFDRDDWYRPGMRGHEYEDRIPPAQIESFKEFEQEWMHGKRSGNVVDDFFLQSYCPKDSYEDDDDHGPVYPPRPPVRRPPPPRHHYPEEDPYAEEQPYGERPWPGETERPPRRYSRDDDYTRPTMPVRPGGFHDRWPERPPSEDPYFEHRPPPASTHPPPLLETPLRPPRQPQEPEKSASKLVNYDDDFTSSPVDEEEEEGQWHPPNHPTKAGLLPLPRTPPPQAGLLPNPTSIPSSVPSSIPSLMSLPQPVPPPISTATSTAPSRPPLFPIMGAMTSMSSSVPKPVPPPASSVRAPAPVPPPVPAPGFLSTQPSTTQTMQASPGIDEVEMEDAMETTIAPKPNASQNPADLEPGEIQDNSDDGNSERDHKHRSKSHKHKKDKHRDRDSKEDKSRESDKWRTGGFSEKKVSERDSVHSSDLSRGQKRSADDGHSPGSKKARSSQDEEDDLSPQEKVDMKNILREVCDQVLDVITGKETSKSSLRHDMQRLNLGQVALVQRVEKLGGLRKKEDALYIINKLCTKPSNILDRLEKLDLQRKLGKVPELTAMYKVVQILGLLRILRKAFVNFFSTSR